MPRVPTAGTTAGPIEFTPQSNAADTRNAFRGLDAITGKVLGILSAKRKKLADAVKKDLFIKKTSEFTRGLTQIQLNADSPQDFREDADSFLSSHLKTIEDKDVALSISQNATFAIDSLDATITAKRAREQRSEAKDLLSNEIAPQYAESIAMARLSGNDVEVDRLESEFLDFVTSSEHHTETEKLELLSFVSSKSQKDSINILLEQGLADPSKSAEPFAKIDILLGSEFTPDLTTKERLEFRKALKTAKNSVKTILDDSLEIAKDRITDDFITRLRPDADLADRPRATEIIASPLGRVETEHFIALSDAAARGIDVSVGDKVVEADLTRAVFDPESINRITNVGQLIPFLGNGLGTDRFGFLKSAINAENNKADRETKNRIEQFIKSVRGRLVQPNAVPDSDPIGEQNLSDLRILVTNLVEEELSKGATLDELLISDGPASKLIPNFERSAFEKTIQIMEAQRVLLQESGVLDSFDEDGTLEVKQRRLRKEGESAAQWIDRNLREVTQ